VKSVILASTSPRRKQLLEQIGVAFTVISPPYEEDMTRSEDPDSLAMLLALGKAQATMPVVEKHNVIVAGDTLIELQGSVLGKPGTPERATEMLRTLRGVTNVVHTGYAVIDMETEDFAVGVVSSRIQMRKYSDDEIERYVATGEPLDKAGSFAVNGIGAILIDRIVDGDFSAIVGLPLAPVAEALQTFGVNVL
jgi:septum formation protein